GMRALVRAHALPVELGAGRLEELPEGHPGGACRLAGATAETEVEMARQPRRQLGPALGRRAHQIDAAARRIHLLPQHAISRALGKADATVDAGAEAIHGRREDGVESALADG